MSLALKDAGCNVIALCPARGHSILKTRAVQRSFTYSSLYPVRSLRHAITISKPDFIVPCDDIAVRHLHELYALSKTANDTVADSVASLIERSIGSPDSYGKTTARNEVMLAARELGLRVPETSLISGVGDLDDYRREHAFPWVLKVDGTWGGLGVRIVNNINEAKEAFSKLSSPLGALPAVKRLFVNRDPYWLLPCFEGSRPAVTVQSYIQGRPANSAIASLNGKVLAGVSVEVIGALSLTGSSSVVRVVENRQMMHASEQLVARLGLSGFHGFDFMIEAHSGIAYLIEMNPRCTPLCPLPLGHGRDMVSALCGKLSGDSPILRPGTIDQDVIAYFPQAWRWNPNSGLLRTSYHDVPWEHPELVEDLMKLPWPDRSLLAQVSNRFRRLSFEERIALGVQFTEAHRSQDTARAS